MADLIPPDGNFPCAKCKKMYYPRQIHPEDVNADFCPRCAAIARLAERLLPSLISAAEHFDVEDAGSRAVMMVRAYAMATEMVGMWEVSPVGSWNQCDGCRAGRPVNAQGHHVMGDGEYADLMACQREKYRPAP